MRARPLGPSGLCAPTVAFGAWTIGGWMWGDVQEDESIRAVRTALDSGTTLIDTAPVYGLGRSETVVGKAIRGRRDQVILATKCGLQWREPRGAFHFATDEDAIRESGSIRVYRWLDPDSLRIEVEQSLRRLGVECIDLYQTHWQDPTTPLEETVGALEDLRTEGKIRAYGCCNATPGQIDVYRQGPGFVSDQERYSLLDREQDGANLPACNRHGLAFLAYSPLAQGLLSGKLTPERAFPNGDLRATRPRFAVENRRRTAVLLDALRPLAEARGITLAQLAIAWALAQPGCTHVLCGARRPQQAAENAQAGDIELTTDELQAIEAALALHASDIV